MTSPDEREPQDRPPSDRKRGRPGKQDTEKVITDGLAALYATVGASWALVNEYDGTVVLISAEKMANAVVQACKPYPDAMAVLRRIVRGNVWTVLVMVHLGPLLAILANHGVVSAELPTKLGLPRPPERVKHEQEQAEQQGPSVGTSQEELQQFWADAIAAETASQAATGTVAGTMAGGAGGPLGDAATVAQQRAYSEAQIASIREQAIQAAIAEQNRARANPETIPPNIYNPRG